MRRGRSSLTRVGLAECNLVKEFERHCSIFSLRFGLVIIVINLFFKFTLKYKRLDEVLMIILLSE